MRVLIVGAGLTGAVIARELAEAGHSSLVIDERKHVAGNCHTARDSQTGILVHEYGPHIFHTDSERAWSYLNRFAEMIPYVNRVKAISRGRVYSLPINLMTINQLFGVSLNPAEARVFIDSKRVKEIIDPTNFEEQALSMVGREIYETFFLGYTKKQWGVDPRRLPPSILKRIPLRFNYDDNYFSHRYQGMPREGYTAAVSKILQHSLIDLRICCKFEELASSESWKHIVYSGPIDRYFKFKLGQLGYRTLDFERTYGKGDEQGTAVINYCDEDIPYTRVSEHKHFSPWEASKFEQTITVREYSRTASAADIPYYPLHLTDNKALLSGYVALATSRNGVTFAGRLGTYSYLDMDVTIDRALTTAQQLTHCFSNNLNPPTFVHQPSST